MKKGHLSDVPFSLSGNKVICRKAYSLYVLREPLKAG